jgi:hypothetical protein
MAIRASHFSFDGGVVRLFVELGSLLFVTGEAHFSLCAFVTHLVLRRMYLVARGTSQAVSFVRAALPQVTVRIFLVASQTCGIPFGCGRRCIAGECSIRFGRFFAAFMIDVALARTVAAGTSRVALIRCDPVPRFAYGK